MAVQRLAAAGLWCEEDVLFSNQRQIDWEKIAEILHTDQEASDFADTLVQMGTFHWRPPESTTWHDVPSKGFDEDGTFRVLSTARVLKDRRTKRTKPPPERNRAQHLRHLRYRGRTLEILHKLKKQNPMFKAMDRPSYFRDHRGLITPWKKIRWERLHQTSLTGRRGVGMNAMNEAADSVPFVYIVRRAGDTLASVGLPLPRHGFRHLARSQPRFTFPPRSDFEIVLEDGASSYTTGAFQVMMQNELTEIRRVELLHRRQEFLPPRFAASRKGTPPAWARSISLAPLITLPAARFRLLSCDAEGGLNLSIEAVVEKALNYETSESKGIRAWSPAPAVYQT